MVTIPVTGGTPAAGAGIISTIVDLPANGSYNISADWQASDDVLPYVAHRSGYEARGIKVVGRPGLARSHFWARACQGGGSRLKEPLDAALRARPDQRRHIPHWYPNIQEGEIIPGTAPNITTSPANANITDVEAEVTIYKVDWFRLSASLAYTDAAFSNWLEISNRGAQHWRPQCIGLPTTTPTTIAHSGGNLTIAGQKISFTPDRFTNTSKWQRAIQAAMLLQA